MVTEATMATEPQLWFMTLENDGKGAGQYKFEYVDPWVSGKRMKRRACAGAVACEKAYAYDHVCL